MTDQAKRPVAEVTGDLDRLCIDTIRTLSMDAVQAASSGHPGTPMALAPVAYCLWQRHLRFDPADPIWPDRDRFILSNGRASMLLYSLLHLTGVQAVNPKYEVTGKPAASLEDIKMFRQLGSHCPGHPEYRWTSGVETTTGPLGQGVATSRDQVLPPQVRARVTVEESSTYGWHRYAGTHGAILGMETFGASAPIQQIQAKFGFEPGHVIEAAKDQLAVWRRE
jgi:transketolase